jgi:hypothetical protein
MIRARRLTSTGNSHPARYAGVPTAFDRAPAMSLPASVIHPRQRRTVGGIALPRIDGRKLSARRFRALVTAYENEFGTLTESDRALIAQVCSIQLRLEELQAATVDGRDVDADQVIRLSSEHRRLLTSLGRKASQHAAAQPSELDEYLAATYGEQTDTEADAPAVVEAEPTPSP